MCDSGIPPHVQLRRLDRQQTFKVRATVPQPVIVWIEGETPPFAESEEYVMIQSPQPLPFQPCVETTGDTFICARSLFHDIGKFLDFR